ncbi:MAG: hypothetical protein R2873_22455 [Caldilineaceae bacterium]
MITGVTGGDRTFQVNYTSGTKPATVGLRAEVMLQETAALSERVEIRLQANWSVFLPLIRHSNE